ncbi:hypothetical protein CRE_30441 [Caenorhabditis remanei]|uniref:UBC core domain-containing protein n=1 Tax=Caenorhabditis remanei TaxID=31234 RepID=E3NDY2_CAERE|nr:hypothetical protein CRE_30441 [Caenorhabditis remanei]
MNSTEKRIHRELRNYVRDDLSDSRIVLELVNNDLMNLKAYMKGVTGTPYEGGKYELDITIDDSYPYKAPTFKFVTRIWNPCVSPFDGTICLDHVGNGVWPVTMTIFEALLIIQSWMSVYDSEHPVDMDISKQAVEHEEIFKKTAKFWATKYAGARNPYNRKLLRKLRLMVRITNNEDLATFALSYHNWVLPTDIKNPRIVRI